MNDKYTIEVLKESDLALMVGGSKESYQGGLISGLLLRGVFIGTPFFRR
ncbi:excreted peptide [Streptococcus mitis B6]|uniref:Excreted peptide n=2 Tax=Streptococcus mitis TaxID=28037 RepID=D3H669_STRM6|nr:excreted peptide [Streptococcus mitis B6]